MGGIKRTPNAAQTRWREAVRSLGSVISGGPAVIHHPVGRTGMHNKTHIGHWWVIPLTDDEHKALHNGQLDFYLCETKWEGMCRKEFEKSSFEMVLNDPRIIDEPISPAVYHAIMDYHR
jgi:hypothetical protein